MKIHAHESSGSHKEDPLSTEQAGRRSARVGEQVFLSVQKEKVISISVVINIHNLLFKAFVLENARAGQFMETVSFEGLVHAQGLLS